MAKLDVMQQQVQSVCPANKTYQELVQQSLVPDSHIKLETAVMV